MPGRYNFVVSKGSGDLTLFGLPLRHHLFLLGVPLFLPLLLWGRIPIPAASVDVRDLAEAAPLVFRGRVASLSLVGHPDSRSGRNKVARFAVDRWYRGQSNTQVSVRFRYNSNEAANGHDCIDFQPGTYWIVFALQEREAIGLFHDCNGALPVSSHLGSTMKAGWLAQMDADFAAGLDDDPAGRLASIQRLGGLKLPSSRAVLHRVIERGDVSESNWAIYAALRTGDISVLPRVKQLLARGDGHPPEAAIALELKNITDPRAVPDLIAILEAASGELTRDCVLQVLGDKLRDPRALHQLADYLSDSDRYAGFDALIGMAAITHAPDCTLPKNWTESDVPPKLVECSSWWKREGSVKFRQAQ